MSTWKETIAPLSNDVNGKGDIVGIKTGRNQDRKRVYIRKKLAVKLQSLWGYAQQTMKAYSTCLQQHETRIIIGHDKQSSFGTYDNVKKNRRKSN